MIEIVQFLGISLIGIIFFFMGKLIHKISNENYEKFANIGVLALLTVFFILLILSFARGFSGLEFLFTFYNVVLLLSIMLLLGIANRKNAYLSIYIVVLMLLLIF